ncbi:3',5'-cyclic-AMP phosphodiesterase [bacterium]|nr:3',5'-cyclic-AMP phosphodiesterase [bacterium]
MNQFSANQLPDELEVLRLPQADRTERPIRIVQITDCHLGQQVGERLAGMDTDESLDHVLALIAEEQPEADLLIATGDLSNHGSEEAYQRLADKLGQFTFPRAWLAGNHDSRALMIDTVGEEWLPRIIDLGNWAILLLDSTVAGAVGGELGDEELQLLRRMLSAVEAEHILVCVHHQPVPVGCSWLDRQLIKDNDALFDVLAQFPSVRGIAWGHVHQQFDRRHEEHTQLQLMATPSTCIQFAPNSQKFQLDRAQPGYRWMDLCADGRIETGVSRLKGIELDVDYESKGYA